MSQLNAIIADTHQLYRTGLVTILERAFSLNKISEVFSGEHVLNLLSKDPYELVLLDIETPVLNGIETAQAICSNFKKTKILTLSFNNDDYTVDSVSKSGAHGFLTKSATADEIIIAVQTVLNGGYYYFQTSTRTKPPKTRSGIPAPELTSREKGIVRLICDGFSSRQMAESLHVSQKTIEGHRLHIYQKLGIKKVTDLIFFAIENGIIIRQKFLT